MVRIDSSGSGEGSENKQFWQDGGVRIDNSGKVGVRIDNSGKVGVRTDISGRDGGGEDRQFWQYQSKAHLVNYQEPLLCDSNCSYCRSIH